MDYLSLVGNGLGKALRWALGQPRLALELLLVAGLVVGGWMYNRSQEELRKAKQESGELEEDLREKLIIKNGELEIIRRENGKVVYEKIYIPPEGSVIIKKRDLSRLRSRYQDLLKRLKKATTEKDREKIRKDIEDVVKDLEDPEPLPPEPKVWGFARHPGWGLEWGNRGLQPRVDFKWFFYKRASTMVGGSKLGLDASVSYHLDQVLWFRPKNIEAFGGYKFVRFNGGETWTVGLRSNF